LRRRIAQKDKFDITRIKFTNRVPIVLNKPHKNKNTKSFDFKRHSTEFCVEEHEGHAVYQIIAAFIASPQR
jgi:hypothetical protein